MPSTQPPVFGLPLPLAPLNGLPIDRPPAVPSRWDDEFPGRSLNAKWTNPTTSANPACVISVANSLLKLTTSAASKHIMGIRQAAPTGDFSVSGLIAYGDTSTADVRLGIFVAIPGGKAHVVGPFPQDGVNGVIGVTTASDTADWSGYDGFLAGYSSSLVSFSRTRIRWVTGSSTLFFDLSRDGITWTNFSSRAAMSQPTEIGIGIYINGAGATITPWLYCDWFRVTTP